MNWQENISVETFSSLKKSLPESQTLFISEMFLPNDTEMIISVKVMFQFVMRIFGVDR